MGSVLQPIAALDFDSEFEKIDSLIELQDLVLKELLTFDSKTGAGSTPWLLGLKVCRHNGA